MAVDREGFAEAVTQKIKNHPLITVKNEEVTSLAALEGVVITATGPLTDGALAEEIAQLAGEDYFHFFGCGSADSNSRFLGLQQGLPCFAL